MKKRILLLGVPVFHFAVVFSQSSGDTYEKVSLEIINTNSTVKNYEIEWLFPPWP